ncbi:MAG TPA: hypothetical protein VK717_00505 [Opitutaceae bacterium]|jgi:hypothetical protein|nr:hypothetical protein [Opitutaceae bacterium]
MHQFVETKGSLTLWPNGQVNVIAPKKIKIGFLQSADAFPSSLKKEIAVGKAVPRHGGMARNQ